MIWLKNNKSYDIAKRKPPLFIIYLVLIQEHNCLKNLMAVSERSKRWNKASKEEYSRLLRQYFTHKFDQQRCNLLRDNSTDKL